MDDGETFGTVLRALRRDRDLSLRALAARTFLSHSKVQRIEQGAPVEYEDAQRLDDALGAEGALVARWPVSRPDGDTDRLAYVRRHPERVDSATVEALSASLAAQRRLEDSIGSYALVGALETQFRLVTEIVQASRGSVRPAVVDIAAQHAQFAGWLSESSGEYDAANSYYRDALEWSTETGDASMVSTITNMLGHIHWTAGRVGPMLGLSRAAQRDTAANPSVRAIAAQQEARGLAMSGDTEGTERGLDKAERLTLDGAETDPPPWLYFFNADFLTMQRGLAYWHLGRYADAAPILESGLAAMAPGIASSGFVAWYRFDLADSYANLGAPDAAVREFLGAAKTAQATGSAGLLRRLNLLGDAMLKRWPTRGDVKTLADALA